MPTNTDIAVGDVVRLKSGGVNMTVQGFEVANGDHTESADGATHLRTVWTDDAGKMHTSHGLKLAMVEVEDRSGPRDSEDKQPQAGSGVDRSISRQDQSHKDWLADRRTPGMGNEGNNSASGLNRPQAAQLQSQNQAAVHEGDDRPQSLGHEAERQPAQESEIAHARVTDDPHDDVETAHQAGKDYQPDKSLKDNR